MCNITSIIFTNTFLSHEDYKEIGFRIAYCCNGETVDVLKIRIYHLCSQHVCDSVPNST